MTTIRSVVIMGVAGSDESVVGRALAARLDAEGAAAPPRAPQEERTSRMSWRSSSIVF